MKERIIESIKKIEKISNEILQTKEKIEDEKLEIYFCDLEKARMDFKMRRRRETIERNIRNTTFNIYITYRNQKNEYLLRFNDEEEFFAFTLYLEFNLNNLKVKELTDDELYKMYHTAKYGLTLDRDK